MIYLHIGTQKTGSSTLQHFMRLNREALADRGYNFVQAVREWSDHNKVARELRGGASELPRLTAVIEEIRASDAPHHIISAEELFHVRAAQRLGLHLPPDLAEQVRIVGYLRRPDDLMEALYKQRIKSAEIEPDPVAYLKRAGFEYRYRPVLDAYADVFGREHMSIRPYSRALLKNSDIIDDFFATIGLAELGDLPREMPQDNPTFSASVSQLMGFYVREGGSNFARLNELIASHNMPLIRRSGDVYRAEQRSEILAETAEDTAAICATYGEHLAPVFVPPDFGGLGEAGYPAPRRWAELNRAAAEAMLRAIGTMQKQQEQRHREEMDRLLAGQAQQQA